MSAKRILLIIDPQNDFCDLPPCASEALYERPALPVPGAHADMLRLAALLKQSTERSHAGFSNVVVTLDAHNPFDIAHPCFWVDAVGENPEPFTFITLNDVSGGLWRAARPELQMHAIEYVRRLNELRRHPLIVWPEHARQGSWGHAVHYSLKAQLDNWSRATLQEVTYFEKGMNPLTEHYSAIRAEVVLGSDTDTNQALLTLLREADEVLVGGEAKSHCVASTLYDIAEEFEGDMRKFVFLEDCSSSVSGLEYLGDNMMRDMREMGMREALSTDVIF